MHLTSKSEIDVEFEDALNDTSLKTCGAVRKC